MYYDLLAIIARSHPWLWEKLHPHVPHTAFTDRVNAVSLNPQPLPPREAFLVGAADLAIEVAQTAVVMESRGESGYGFLTQIVDDWCGTPWPRRWPWPFPGPGPDPDPDPNPWWQGADIAGGRVIAATVFASYASRIADDKFSSAFAEASERLAEAAIGAGPRAAATASRATKARTAKRSSRR